jgi:hypothetical protein
VEVTVHRCEHAGVGIAARRDSGIADLSSESEQPVTKHLVIEVTRGNQN